MGDRLTKDARSKLMSCIRSKGNRATELLMVSILRKSKITGWRRHLRIEGCPDFAFPKEKIALFIDGCFWHGCPKHCRMPASNMAYWSKKIERNRIRDRLVLKHLKQSGWRVIRIWEHSLRTPQALINKIRRAVNLEQSRLADNKH